MRFTVVSLFPEMFESFFSASLLGKARDKGLVEIDFVDPRDFADDPHRSVDDSPYGGGAGMVMKVEPMVAAIESIKTERGAPHRIMLAPSGAPLSQDIVRRLATLDHVVLVCGRYEGPDERIIDLAIDEVLSIGDYVLSGGEAAAITIIDAVARLIPGVLGKVASTLEESFEGDLLEYPHYTRPIEFRGHSVPEVLRGGNHAAIAEWRNEKARERTRERRPDLYRRYAEARAASERTYVVLAHHPVLDRTGAEVTSSVTNLDIHDIARTATTFGVAGYLAVSPVQSQREKITGIAETWKRLAASEIGDHRHRALGLLEAVPSLAAAAKLVAKRHKNRWPLIVVTSARDGEDRIGPGEAILEIAEHDGPTLLVFGTGWGLADSVTEGADRILAPILGAGDFNHLSVRSAVAIVLDRLFGASCEHHP